MGKFARRAGVAWRLLRSRLTENSAVLLYHRVAEDPWDPFRLCVAPERFAEQLETLRKDWRVLAPDEFARRQREGVLEKGSLCLTFDDGYLDFRESALPLLEACEIPAAVFCVAEGLGESLWWDRLHETLASAEAGPGGLAGLADLAGFVFPGSGGESALPGGVSDVPEAFRKLYPVLRDLPPEERSAQLEALSRAVEENGGSTGRGDAGGASSLPRPSAPSWTGRRLMTAAEIAEIASHPLVTLGAHTLSHPNLAKLDPEAQFAEIGGSLKVLSELAGRPVRAFSYPYGLRGRDYTAATCAAARRAGLDHAFAADAGAVTRRSDPMALPRLWAHDEEPGAFRRRLLRWR